MSVEGTYDCVTRTPMGELASRFTVQVDGDRFTGVNEGNLGTMEVENGKVEGNRLIWTMQMTTPMPMSLDCEATIEGDKLIGNITAGAFGSMPMSGTRVSG